MEKSGLIFHVGTNKGLSLEHYIEVLFFPLCISSQETFLWNLFDLCPRRSKCAVYGNMPTSPGITSGWILSIHGLQMDLSYLRLKLGLLCNSAWPLLTATCSLCTHFPSDLLSERYFCFVSGLYKKVNTLKSLSFPGLWLLHWLHKPGLCFLSPLHYTVAPRWHSNLQNHHFQAAHYNTLIKAKRMGPCLTKAASQLVMLHWALNSCVIGMIFPCFKLT